LNVKKGREIIGKIQIRYRGRDISIRNGREAARQWNERISI